MHLFWTAKASMPNYDIHIQFLRHIRYSLKYLGDFERSEGDYCLKYKIGCRVPNNKIDTSRWTTPRCCSITSQFDDNDIYQRNVSLYPVYILWFCHRYTVNEATEATSARQHGTYHPHCWKPTTLYNCIRVKCHFHAKGISYICLVLTR